MVWKKAHGATGRCVIWVFGLDEFVDVLVELFVIDVFENWICIALDEKLLLLGGEVTEWECAEKLCL